jgi:hypothetical protein
MTETQEWREDSAEFRKHLFREFPKATEYAARQLLNAASVVQKAEERFCCEPMTERESERLRARVERAEETARRTCARIGGEFVQGEDVRGWPMLIRCPSGFSNDWGGRGLGIPGRGYPTSRWS